MNLLMLLHQRHLTTVRRIQQELLTETVDMVLVHTFKQPLLALLQLIVIRRLMLVTVFLLKIKQTKYIMVFM